MFFQMEGCDCRVRTVKKNREITEKVDTKISSLPEENSSELSVRINTNCFRFTIHKNTLSVLGNPEFIQLGYQVRTKQMLIAATDSMGTNKVHLYFTKNGTCYVHSKAMIDGIRRVSGILKESGSYLVKGILTEAGNVICFNLEEAEVSSGDEFDDDIE